MKSTAKMWRITVGLCVAVLVCQAVSPAAAADPDPKVVEETKTAGGKREEVKNGNSHFISGGTKGI